MALSKGKKVLIAIVGAVVTIGAVIGTVFAVKKIKENVEMTDRPGITTPVDPTPDTPVDPTPDEPVDPTPDEPVDPDPDTPVDPDPGEEEPETPEISEEDYRIQNVELLKEILAREYNQFTKTEYANFNLENIDNIILNPAAGEVYFTADMSGIFGGTLGNFNITGTLGQSFDWQSQEELNKFLTSFNDSESDMTFEDAKATMSSQVSEGKYDEFIDFVKKQSYDGVDLSSVPNEDFFGVTWFIRDNDAHGYSYVEYNAINNGNVYTIHLENVKPTGAGDRCITELMSYSNSVFKVVDVQPFEKFDLETPIIESSAQASVDLSLDFRGTTFDEISATEFASAFFDDSRVSRVHIQYENQDGEEQRGVLVRGGKGGGGENKNTESDEINNMSMLF